METTIALLKSMGFIWETNTIGIMFERGMWNVNVWLKNADGSRKPAYGFLKYDTVEEAVMAEKALQA
jgi:hypothetical protein